MLQKIKYEAVNFGKYDKLRKKFQQADFDPLTVHELDLSHQNTDLLPPVRCLEMMENLTTLILSNNLICRFSSQIILHSAPLLEALDLSNNKIDVIDDLVDLGSLQNLKILEFSFNPVCNYLQRIVIIKELLYPLKYAKYDPVKILTADYNVVPNPKLTKEEQEKLEQDMIINEKVMEELEPEQYQQFQVSKFTHKNTLAKLAAQPCPVPRLSRFKNLEYINGEILTKFDIMRASGKRDMKQILEDNNKQKLGNSKIQRKNLDQHNKYLKKYMLRVKRLYNEKMDFLSFQVASTGKSDEDYFKQIDEEFYKMRNVKLDPKVYDPNICQTPMDIVLKNSTYETSIKQYKQMIVEHDLQQQQKDEKQVKKLRTRLEKSKQRVYRKLNRIGVKVPESEEEEEQLGLAKNKPPINDQELKQLFHFKQSKCKPKFDLDKDEKKEYGTSESDLSEELNNSNQSSLRNTSDNDKEEDNDGFSSDSQMQSSRNDSAGGGNKMKLPLKISAIKESEKEHDLDDSLAIGQDGERLNSQRRLQQLQSMSTSPLAAAGVSAAQVAGGGGKREIDILELKKKLDSKQNQVQQASSNVGLTQKFIETAQQRQKIKQQKEKQRDYLKDKNENKDKQTEQQDQDQKNVSNNEEEGNNNNNNDNPKQNQIQLALATSSEAQKQQIQQSRILSPNQSSEFNSCDKALSRYTTYREGGITEEVQQQYQNVDLQSQGIKALTVNTFQLKVPISVNQQQVQQKVLEVREQVDKASQVQNKIFFRHQSQHSHTSTAPNTPPRNRGENFVRFSQYQQQSQMNQQQGQTMQQSQSPSEDANQQQPLIPPLTSQVTQANKFQIGTAVKRAQSMSTIATSQKQLQQANKQNKGRKEPPSQTVKVIVKGNLLQEDYQKADIPLDSLLPTVEQGMPEHFRVGILYDFKSPSYQELKHYKNVIEGAENLKRAVDELQSKLQIIQVKKKRATSAQQNPVTFNKMYQYLSTDKNFAVQNSYDPAEKVIYQVTRNKKKQIKASLPSAQNIHQQQPSCSLTGQQQSNNKNKTKNKVSTYDLRDIFYRANDYNKQDEPRITEKEVWEALNNKDIPLEQKDKYYEWLELLQQIKLKKQNVTENELKRMEQKEIERAENNAHLAYHYQKLKTYINDGNLEKYMHLLTIGQLDNGKIKTKSSQKSKAAAAILNSNIADNRLVAYTASQTTNSVRKKSKEATLNTGYNPRSFSTNISQHQKKEGEEQVEGGDNAEGEAQNKNQPPQAQKQEEFFKHIDKLQQLKSEIKPAMQKPAVNLTGPVLESMPNINQMVNQKKYSPPPQHTFEELVDNNLRKIQENFQKSQKTQGVLSMEEQMLKYATEFKEKVKKREVLKQNIENYINDNKKKLDEFLEWDRQEHEKRHDVNYCFKNYVKQVREGKL